MFVLLTKTMSAQAEHRLVAADVADLQAQRLLGSIDFGIPKVLCLLTVEDDVTELVDFDFCIAMPLTFCRCAVNGEVFDCFQTFFTDSDRIELFLLVGTHVLGVEVIDL